MSDWSQKQFAMELVVRGGYGVKSAIETMRHFEREWIHEDSRLRVESETLMQIFKGKHPTFALLPEGPLPIEKLRAIREAIRDAGRKALAESRSAEPS